MTIWLPRTMTGLVAAGCVLAALPLLVALLLAGSALERLTRNTEALMHEGLVATQLGAQLRDELRDLARNAEQYAALGDPELLEVMAKRERSVRAALDRMVPLASMAGAVPLRRDFEGVARGWEEAVAAGMPLGGAAAFSALSPRANELIAAARTTTDRQLAELTEATAGARFVMLASALTLLPLTALLTYGFSAAVTRPLRAVAGAIAALGHGRYERPVVIRYPREMEQVGSRLDWLRERLATLERDKDRFLRHVSHELKTPLATLQEGAALLRDRSLGPLTERQREVTQILVEASVELGAQIGNLLAYAEWRRGERRAAPTWFEARTLISEVLIAQKLHLARRGLSVELGARSARLFGQRGRLRVALDNLLGNAIKHAPRGSVIEVGAAVREGHFELRVRDRGRGVPAQDRERIFEPFVRGTETEESRVRGTGIGLSIVRETALAHDGTVEVEDAQPGARFRMVWPCPADGAGAGTGAVDERVFDVADEVPVGGRPSGIPDAGAGG